MAIHRVPVTITAVDAEVTLLAAQSEDGVLRLIAFYVTTEDTDADMVLVDEDDNALSGVLHMGTGTGGWHHSSTPLGYNPVGWVETPKGKGLKVTNPDAAGISGLAIIQETHYEN